MKAKYDALLNKLRQKDDDWKRTATLIVAASDSKDKEHADYVCDGTADEVEINQAISDLPATGGSVILMDGTFNIDATITLDKTISLIGQGKSTIILTDTAIEMINITANNCEVKDIYFSGVKASACEAIDVDADYWLIENCYFYQTYYGIRGQSGYDFPLITNCTFYDNVRAVYLLSVDYVRISGCYFYSCDAYDIYVIGNYATSTGNLHQNSNYAEYFTGNYATSTGNFVYGATQPAITIDNSGTAVGNLLVSCSNKGISLEGYSCSAVGNSFYRCNQPIYSAEGSHTIAENSIYDTNGSYPAIDLTGSDYHTITGNVIKKANREGIKIDDCQRCVISNNSIYGAGDSADDTYAAILLTGTSTYNNITGNNVSSAEANKHKYGIREDSSSDDYNCIIGNICTDAATEDISIQGVNTEVGHNIIS